jgi:hypothetical protein
LVEGREKKSFDIRERKKGKFNKTSMLGREKEREIQWSFNAKERKREIP